MAFHIIFYPLKCDIILLPFTGFNGKGHHKPDLEMFSSKQIIL